MTSQIPSTTDWKSKTLGDPDCPKCRGSGYLRLDVPIDHPQFGKLQVCSCRSTEMSQQVRQKLFSLSNLDQLTHLTFESFNPRGRVGLPARQAESLERAFETSLRFCNTLSGWLVLQGGFGCGKTHLAAAIANFVVSIGVPTLFLTVPDLLDQLRFSFSDETTSFEERFNEIRNASLLILDDFGTQNATPWAQEKLFQIINYRYINKLPMVITTNIQFESLDGRIRSRLEDRELVDVVLIGAPDYRNPISDLRYHELSDLDRHPDKTFQSFSLRKEELLSKEDRDSLIKAHMGAEAFAKEPKGWLVLKGGYGTGKTHLAAAITHYLVDHHQEAMFVSVSDFLDELRATFNPNSLVSMSTKFQEAKDAPVLILDDLQTRSMSPWVREKIHQLICYRFDKKLPTVITTTETSSEMDERIQSRLKYSGFCANLGITVPSYPGSTPKKRTSTKKDFVK